MTIERKATYNSTYPKGGVSCSKDSFVVNGTLVFQIKFCGKSPALRVAANRCKPYKNRASMKQRIVFIGFLILALNAFAGSEKDFWESYKKADFETASIIGEKLGESNIDYLFLSSVCNHNKYDYDLYYQKSDYYHHVKNGNYSSLEKLLKENYIENDYSINNLMGIIKNLIPELKLNSAQSYFNKSVDLKSDNPIAHNYLSMIYIQNGEIDKGIELAKTAIKEDNTYPEPYNNLTFGYYKKGENKKATENLIECMKMCPKNTNSTYINFIQLSCKEVVLLVNNTIIGVPGFEFDSDREHLFAELKGKNNALLSLANQFYSYNSYKEVDLILNEINVDKSNQDQFYFLKSMNSIIAGDTIRHKENLEKLVEIKAFDYVLEIGNYFYENQNMKLALETYEKAEPLAISNDSKVKVISNIGAVNLQLGRYEDAIKTFEKVLKINDKDDITLTNLGITYALNKDKVNAKKYLLKAKENCTSENQMNAIEQWLKKIEE
jgi:Flp pilus assembly protein TadD